MLGLDDKKHYEAWTKIFNPTSTYEGTWDEGGKIYFIGYDKYGKRQGMLATIKQHLPEKFVSIYQYGLINGEDEITTGEQVSLWAGGYENYYFIAHDGMTTVTVDIDMNDEFVMHFKTIYPKALEALKETVINRNN